MKIHVGFDLTYESAHSTPMIFMLNVHPSRAHDLITPDRLRITPSRAISPYIDSETSASGSWRRPAIYELPAIPSSLTVASRIASTLPDDDKGVEQLECDGRHDKKVD